ncbi:hypothetical protein pmac_cds_642 [Pandoravirus macleodensis]|uniref:F-box incomplete domain containing protein n=1 Tax=Pandoravirus macleodensis TaxID=2107707 RepID=A0A2U7UG65_9VIRU|nr:hypothetical protein pmac_cds_642 [Pandoravirus macleodensis]AVK77330.1 hypothetical protein pmac_cds_642 [Pandoravirus macleodensis]
MDTDDDDGAQPDGLETLPSELVHMIVNGRDRRGIPFLHPRWRCMVRMTCRAMRWIIEHPATHDYMAMSDFQTLYRGPEVGAARSHHDFDITHARRRRWRRGTLVCASAVAEWLAARLAPCAVLQDDQLFGSLVDRMIDDWGASRPEAHLALLASDHPGAVAYASDPRTTSRFAALPTVAGHVDSDPPAYGPSWQPDGQELAYAMLDVAARRCSVGTVKAVVAMIDVAAWMVAIKHEASCREYRGLMRSRFCHSILAFDRDDVIQALGRSGSALRSVQRMVAYNAGRCLRQYMDLCNKDPGWPKRLREAVYVWRENESYPGLIATAPEIDNALRVVWGDLRRKGMRKEILLDAIEGDALGTVLWMLGAMGHAKVSADVLVRATAMTHDALVRCALGSRMCAQDPACRSQDYAECYRACGTRVAEWLCDTLDYTPTADALRRLVDTCVTDVSDDRAPWCCVQRAVFLLKRWPHLVWQSGVGVNLVRRAFRSRTAAATRFTSDTVFLIDAIEAWCKAIDANRDDMFNALALGDVLASDKPLSWRIINVVCGGEPWGFACDTVCYGTCRRESTPQEVFCNGRRVTDADAIAAWCVKSHAQEPVP